MLYEDKNFDLMVRSEVTVFGVGRRLGLASPQQQHNSKELATGKRSSRYEISASLKLKLIIGHIFKAESVL